jgi:hypothetical protein
VADLDDGVFEGRSAFVDHVTVLAEDRPAARAAVHVALVGDGEMRVVDPGNRVRLTRDGQFVWSNVSAPSSSVSTPSSATSPAEKWLEHGAIGRQHDDVVVLLQRDDDLVLAVDRHELRLRILWRDVGKAGHVRHDLAVAVHRHPSKAG